MPNIASLFSDWLLEPLWALFGVDGDSLLGEMIGWAAGAIVSALGAGLLVLLHLLWRAVCRYRDGRAIAKLRQDSPSSTLILVSDFAGKGGEAWGGNIVDRLQPDFEAFSGGSSARLHHWTERFASSDGGLRPARFERAVARARTVLRKQRADLIIWGRYVGGDGLRLHIVSAVGKAQRPDIALDFRAEGHARLTREMGDAIAYFAAQLANKDLHNLDALTGSTLEHLTAKLQALVVRPPNGLTAEQIRRIEDSFDSVAWVARQRAFPAPSPDGAIWRVREKRARSFNAARDPEGFAKAWADWAIIAAEGGVSYLCPAIFEAQEVARSPETRARLHIAAALANSRDSSGMKNKADLKTAKSEAEAAVQVAKEPRSKAAAQLAYAAAVKVLGATTLGANGVDLLREARNAALQSIAMLAPGSVFEFAEAHRLLGEATSHVLDRLPATDAIGLFGSTRDTMVAGLSRIDTNKSPRCACLVELQIARLTVRAVRTNLHLPDMEKALTGAVNLSLAARARVSGDSAPELWTDAVEALADAYCALGELKRSPMVLKQAAQVAMTAAASSPIAAATAYIALLVRAEILCKDSTRATEVNADLKEALALMAAVQPQQSPHNQGALAGHRGLALRLLAQVSVSAKEAATLYTQAATSFGDASGIFSRLGARQAADKHLQEAEECSNLAKGISRAK